MATVEASHYAKVYWGFAGAAIAVATAVNVIEKAICWQRCDSKLTEIFNVYN